VCCNHQGLWIQGGEDGCLKLQVSFCRRATKYRALLRKMTSKDKVSYDSTPPCIKKDSKSTHTHTHETPQPPPPTHIHTHTHIFQGAHRCGSSIIVAKDTQLGSAARYICMAHKLQVSLRKRATKYWALLRKMTSKDET